MVNRLRGAAIGDDALELEWHDAGGPRRMPWLWLRDHCPCPQCLHPETLQRQLDTFAIAPDVRGREIHLDPEGRWVDVIWNDHDARARYSSDLLACIEHEPTGAARAPRRESWDGAAFPDGLPTADYEAVLRDDGALRAYLAQIERHGFCLARNCAPTPEATRALAERVAYVRKTLFGEMWDWSADVLLHADTAYTNLAIRLHTDGTYVHDAPGLQMLHCLAFDGTGGESVIVDGLRVAERLARDDRQAFRVLTTVSVPGRYLEAGVSLRSSRPVIRLGPAGDIVQISYNNHDRAPFRLPGRAMDDFYEALRAFNSLVEDPALQLRFRLRPGEPLLLDNWRLLHGREAYTGRRRMAGCLNREDFESRLRVLRGPASGV